VDFLPEGGEIAKRLLRHEAFFGPAFEGEGAYFFIQAPNPTALAKFPAPKRPLDLAQRWLDPEYRVMEHLWGATTKYYAGDAIPVIFLNFGCGNLAALLGTGYKMAEETIWFDAEPLAMSHQDLPTLVLQRDHPLCIWP
jgi:hypothetical protein